jgi:alpha-galactosidase
MIYTLDNPYLHFALDPQKATWSLFSHEEDGAFLEGVGMQASYRRQSRILQRPGRARFRALTHWPKPRISVGKVEVAHQGELSVIKLHVGPDQNGLLYTLNFALPENEPLFLWNLDIQNQGQHPIYVGRIELLRTGFFPKKTLLPEPGTISLRFNPLPEGRGVVRPHPEPGEIAFFSNGWQSWSHTGVYGNEDRFRKPRLAFPGVPVWYNLGTPIPSKAGHFVGDMFGVLGDRTHRRGILAGFLSQREHFGSLEVFCDSLYPALRMWANGDNARLDPGANITTDWAVLHFHNLDDPEPLGPYLNAVVREHDIPPGRFSAQPSPTGWCSWYHFYQNLSTEDIRGNLQAADKLRPEVPLDLIQIDDGFEAQVGDWFGFSPGFPDGVKGLAEEIRTTGFSPGLWLAPFIVHPRSQLAKEHPEWLLRNRLGRPVYAGFQWNSLTTALDLTHPEALEYACQVVQTAAHEWGYPYLKLDFLYAAALPGVRHDPTRTRAQVLRMALEALRQGVGDEIALLGCGCPLGSALGLVESMRIGADVDSYWQPVIYGNRLLIAGEPNMPSVRNSLQNILSRAFLHRHWWLNDPDCLLLRPDTDLTLDEVKTLAAAIALTGGSFFISDHLPELPPERLRIAEALMPLIGRRPRVIDWFDSTSPRLLRLDLENETGFWHLLAVINWDDQPRDLLFSLSDFLLDPQDEYHARTFWDDSGEGISVLDGRLVLKDIPAHGVRLLSLRPVGPDTPSYLGSDLHISQGLEVTHWEIGPSDLQFKLERPGKAHGEIELYLPRAPQSITLNNQALSYRPAGSGRYYIPIQFDRVAEIQVR